MKISAVKLFDGGFMMKSFACGGGLPEGAIKKTAGYEPAQVSKILITHKHPDHTGELRHFPNAKIFISRIVFAPGHTKGNSIVIVDAGDKFYIIHGDVTYTDEALIENKLSVVFEDLPAARDTLNRVRAFIKANPTVYLSTHTPLGYENLDAQKIMSLPDVEEAPAIEEQADKYKATGTKWVCSVCGYEHFGDEPPAVCPRCKQPASAFRKA